MGSLCLEKTCIHTCTHTAAAKHWIELQSQHSGSPPIPELLSVVRGWQKTGITLWTQQRHTPQTLWLEFPCAVWADQSWQPTISFTRSSFFCLFRILLQEHALRTCVNVLIPERVWTQLCMYAFACGCACEKVSKRKEECVQVQVNSFLHSEHNHLSFCSSRGAVGL